MKKMCQGPKCDRPAVARGLCNSHWAQQSRHGTLSPIITDETPIDRFYRYIRKNENGCWLWIGAGSGKFYDRESGEGGYGQLRINGKSWMAHRWAYMYFKGVSLHPEDTLDHLCRVTRCCNPDHLEVVGRGENIKRMHLYSQLASENRRFREFLISKGYNPDQVLGGGLDADVFAI